MYVFVHLFNDIIDFLPLIGGGGNGDRLNILVWKIPWTEDPGSYSPWGC